MSRTRSGFGSSGFGSSGFGSSGFGSSGFGIVLAATISTSAIAESPAVRLTRLPDGGFQPQSTVDAGGAVHLVYFRGEPATGDIYYARRQSAKKAADAAEFSAAIRVNSQAGSAVAAGTIRGAQIAVGRGGRVHVAWNGSGRAEPRGLPNPELPEDNPHRLSAPMLYARTADDGAAFEPQRNLMTRSFALDGGGSVAADAEGRVWVVWHAASEGAARGEAGRAVWVARSNDDGATFAPEERANKEPTGACGCCSLRAWADPGGAVHILYRSATRVLNRDIYWLRSTDRGASFKSELVDRWNVATCVMSSASFAGTSSGDPLAAWETREQVFFAPRSRLDAAIAVTGTGRPQKHPVIATNARGEILLAWTEGTGWKRGGSVAWRVFDASGAPITAIESRPGVPVWGTVAAFADADGGFTILY